MKLSDHRLGVELQDAFHWNLAWEKGVNDPVRSELVHLVPKSENDRAQGGTESLCEFDREAKSQFCEMKSVVKAQIRVHDIAGTVNILVVPFKSSFKWKAGREPSFCPACMVAAGIATLIIAPSNSHVFIQQFAHKAIQIL
jgi:hypothetical protein